MKYLIITLVFCFVALLKPIELTANPQIDSILKELPRLSGVPKASAYGRLGQLYFFMDYNTAIYYARQAAMEAKKANDEFYYALMLANVAAVQIRLIQLRNAMDTLNLSNEIFSRIGYKPGQVYCYSQIGNIYTRFGGAFIKEAAENYTKALSFYTLSEVLDSIKYYNTLKDGPDEHQRRFINIYAIALNDFGLFRQTQKDYNASIELYNQALELGKSINREERIGGALANIGMSYMRMKDFKKAEEYFLESIEIFKNINHKLYLGNTLANLAELNIENQNFKAARNYAFQAYEVYESISDSSSAIHNLIAEIEKNEKNHDIALKHLLISKEIFTKTVNIPSLLITYKNLSELYYKMGRYKLSSEYGRKYIELSDTTYNKDRLAEMNHLLAFYEVDKKKNELDLLNRNIELITSELKRKELESFVFVIAAILLLALLVGLIVIMRIRTKNKEMIENKNKLLEKVNAELKEINDTKDKFFSIIAHDIKNPLASIKQVTEIMVDESIELDEQDKIEFNDSLNKSAVRLLNLLDNLLTWARTQTGKLVPHKEYVNFEELAENSFQLLNDTAKKKSITIVPEITQNIGIYADFNMIETVLRNLISNAIKFTHENGKIYVRSSISNDNNYAIIEVEDTGVGMSQEIIDKLFRLDKNRSELGTNKEEGTGLGLLICKDFVEANNGIIMVESNLGKGSIFRFTVPIYKEELAQND